MKLTTKRLKQIIRETAYREINRTHHEAEMRKLKRVIREAAISEIYRSRARLNENIFSDSWEWIKEKMSGRYGYKKIRATIPSADKIKSMKGMQDALQFDVVELSDEAVQNFFALAIDKAFEDRLSEKPTVQSEPPFIDEFAKRTKEGETLGPDFWLNPKVAADAVIQVKNYIRFSAAQGDKLSRQIVDAENKRNEDRRKAEDEKSKKAWAAGAPERERKKKEQEQFCKDNPNHPTCAAPTDDPFA